MSEQPQGPGWWRASDGRWYPPSPTRPYPAPEQPRQPPFQHPYAQQQHQPQPPPKKSNGCFIAAVVVAAVVVLGLVVAGYFVYQAVNRVAEVATGVGTTTCPDQAQVSQLVGGPVELKVRGSVVVASGCSYLAADRGNGADVQITTGLGLAYDDQAKSFDSDAATQNAQVETVDVGERGRAYGGEQRSAAMTLADGKVVEVEVTAAGAAIGDKESAAVALLRTVVG